MDTAWTILVDCGPPGRVRSYLVSFSVGPWRVHGGVGDVRRGTTVYSISAPHANNTAEVAAKTLAKMRTQMLAHAWGSVPQVHRLIADMLE